jgi:hypothetical protein
MDTVIDTDFNERDRDRNIIARLPCNSRPVQIGQRVQVRDGEGNLATGHILSMEHALLHIKVDWETWRDDEKADA